MKRVVIAVVLLGGLFVAVTPDVQATHMYACPATGVDLADAAWCGANCTWDAFTGGSIKRVGQCWNLF